MLQEHVSGHTPLRSLSKQTAQCGGADSRCRQRQVWGSCRCWAALLLMGACVVWCGGLGEAKRGGACQPLTLTLLTLTLALASSAARHDRHSWTASSTAGPACVPWWGGEWGGGLRTRHCLTGQRHAQQAWPCQGKSTACRTLQVEAARSRYHQETTCTALRARPPKASPLSTPLPFPKRGRTARPAAHLPPPCRTAAPPAPP